MALAFILVMAAMVHASAMADNNGLIADPPGSAVSEPIGTVADAPAGALDIVPAKASVTGGADRNVPPVPEPSGILAMVTGLGGLATYLRRRYRVR